MIPTALLAVGRRWMAEAAYGALIVLGILLIVWGAYRWAYGEGYSDAAAKAEAARVAQVEALAGRLIEEQARFSEIADRSEQQRARIQTKFQTIFSEVIREVESDRRYGDCVLPADGVRLLNAARSGADQAAGSGAASAPLPAHAAATE